MRLAFIKKKYSVHGGAERYLQSLIKQLKQADFEIGICVDLFNDLRRRLMIFQTLREAVHVARIQR